MHTVPTVPLGSGGESEFELAPRPKRGAARYPKRRMAGSNRADDDDSFFEDGFGEGGPAAALDVTEDLQEAALAVLADEVEPVLLAPPPLVPPEDVAQGSVGATVVAEETCPPVEQVPMPPPSHPSPPRPLFWAAGESSRRLLCAPSKANLTSTTRRVASSRPHATTWPTGNVRSRAQRASLLARVAHAPVGGRPLGFMSHWLTNSFVESREERWSAEVPRGVQQSDREAADIEGGRDDSLSVKKTSCLQFRILVLYR